MPIPNRSLLPCLLAAALTLPANIYVIGGALGAGLQCPLFRYQQTYLGTSVITLADDLGYVASGIIGGRSALSILLWAFGTALLLAAAGYLIYSRYYSVIDSVIGIRKPLFLLTAGGAVAVYILKAEEDEDEPEYEEKMKTIGRRGKRGSDTFIRLCSPAARISRLPTPRAATALRTGRTAPIIQLPLVGSLRSHFARGLRSGIAQPGHKQKL